MAESLSKRLRLARRRGHKPERFWGDTMSIVVNRGSVTLKVEVLFDAVSVTHDLDLRDLRMPEGYVLENVDILFGHAGLSLSIGYYGSPSEISFEKIEASLKEQLCP